MYSDPAEVHFLDQEDYNDYALPKDDLAEELQYLTEKLEGVMALIYNDQCVGIQLPLTVELKVVRVRPGHQRRIGHLPNQARHPGNRPGRASARISGSRRDDQSRHPQRGVHLQGIKKESPWRITTEARRTRRVH